MAEGRLHLGAVCLLAPHLTAANADELLAAATNKTKSEIEQLLAERFPRPDLMTLVQAIPVTPPLANERLAPAHVDSDVSGDVGASADQPAAAPVDADASSNVRALTCQLAPGRLGLSSATSVIPLSADHFAVQFVIDRVTHDKLQCVQALLSNRLPSADVAQVFGEALDTLKGQLEKRKFAATSKPRRHPRRASADPATSRRTSCALSGSETRASARSSARTDTAAGRASSCSTTM